MAALLGTWWGLRLFASYDGRVKALVSQTVRLIAVVALVTAAGCSGPSAETADSSKPDKATAPSPTQTAAPAPGADACYQLVAADVDRAHNESTPVPCTSRHTSQTYVVDTLAAATIGDPQDIDGDALLAAAEQRCRSALPEQVGGSAKDRALSRVTFAWFVPSEAEIAKGADWVRCDVVASRDDTDLATLPRSSKDLLAPDEALERWGICARATAAELQAGKGQRMCAVTHNWRAVSTYRLGDADAAWPGEKSVGGRILQRCEKPVRAFLDDSTGAVTVGWLPPTSAQWAQGRRSGLCWANTK